MPDNPSYYATTDQINAVATLMYHCGVSLNMDYGTAASGGSSAIGLVGHEGYASIDNALKNYFHYSRNMQVRAVASAPAASLPRRFSEPSATSVVWRGTRTR